MSNAIFPTLPGLSWPVIKTPEWTTGIQKTASGRELRASYSSYPRWRIRLGFEVLSQTDLASLAGFFNARRGSFDNFLFFDKVDNSVANQVFAVGDGQSTSFQLVRNYGGVTEPVSAVVSAAVYLSDWRGNSLQYTTPRTNLLPRSVVSGAIAGSPGTMPAGWSIAQTPAGCSYAVTGTGTEANGLPYVDVRFYGTPTNSNGWLVNFGAITVLAGAYTTSLYTKLVSGALSGSTSLSGGGTNGAGGAVVLSGTFQRVSALQANVTSGVAYPWLQMNVTSGVAHDVTLRFAAPQFEAGSIATSYIPTTGTATTVTDYSIDSNAVVTFSTAPAAGATLSWSGQYYFRVRFTQDSSDFEQFMSNLWCLKKLEFITEKA